MDGAEDAQTAARHYLTIGARAGLPPSPIFDPETYKRDLPWNLSREVNPLVHFLRGGWRAYSRPSGDFDPWPYWERHMQGTLCEDVNPLVHYATQGHGLGFESTINHESTLRIVRESGVFDEKFYLQQVAGTTVAEWDPLVHFMRTGHRLGLSPSPWFDISHYLTQVPELLQTGENPLAHFLRNGNWSYCNPCPEFDTWWYRTRFMGANAGLTNPLVHFLEHGRHRGISPATPKPLEIARTAGPDHLSNQSSKNRACLVAGFDRNGVIKDYVVDYVRELSRHGDVFYLADCHLDHEQLQRLAPFVKGAWAYRHGAYDFGSYSRLLCDHIGWEVIATYEEVLLVNDSAYLLCDLDQIFDRMNNSSCDWWGLAAMSGLIDQPPTRRAWQAGQGSIDDITEVYARPLSEEYLDSLHVGSYFLAFRRGVLEDSAVRSFFENVASGLRKDEIIRRYEIGLSRFLHSLGYALDTYVSKVYPYHPVYTEWFRELLGDGFPLLKRSLVLDNPVGMEVPEGWHALMEKCMSPSRLRYALDDLKSQGWFEDSDADPELHGSEDLRISDPTTTPLLRRVMDARGFLWHDLRTEKDPNTWAFPVCGFTRSFSGNERAVFEAVKDDVRVKKVVLTRGEPVALTGKNVEVVPLDSRLGQYHLLRSGVVFIKHSVDFNLGLSLDSSKRRIVNLWHGIPLKRINYTSIDQLRRQRDLQRESLDFHSVICSSETDRLAMSAAHYPLPLEAFWITGLPRTDFIVSDVLPTELEKEQEKLLGQLQGRKLVLYAPTFRNNQASASYQFNEKQVTDLHALLEEHGAVLGIRLHMASKDTGYMHKLAGPNVIDLSDAGYLHTEVLLKSTDILITDYSSIFFDFLVTGRPMVSFAYDYEQYRRIERGTFYNLKDIFPGPVVSTFEEALLEVRKALQAETIFGDRRYRDIQRMFHKYLDGENANRLVELLRRRR